MKMILREESKLEISEQENKQWPQWLATIIASLSFFTAGICCLWSSPSLAILQSPNTPFTITNSEASWIAAFLPIGCGIGPIVGAWTARHVGPKTTTLITAIPYVIGFALILVANSSSWLYASRFLCGFAVGLGQTATPIYIAEVSETRNRGRLVSFVIFGMGLGGLFMTALGPYFSLSTMSLISMTFPILLLVLVNFLPESPFFLVRTQKEEKARKSLMWFRNQEDESGIKVEFEEIKMLASENMLLRDSFALILTEQNLKKLGFITLTFTAQSFSGAIVVMFFQEQIYSKAKVPIPADIAVILTACVSNVSGLISMLVVDHWGRKPLLLTSTIGSAASTALIGCYLHLEQNNGLKDIPYINWLPIVALNTLQIFFFFGLSPIPTTQLGEIFCSNVKEIAFCYGTTVAAFSGVIVTKLFQVLEDSYGLPVAFWCLSLITVVLFVLMVCFVPETKGKTFAEIQSSLFSKKQLSISQELYVSTVSDSCYDNALFKNVI